MPCAIWLRVKSRFGTISGLCPMSTPRRCSRGATRCRVFTSWPCCRISPRNGGCNVPSTPSSAVFESSHEFEFFDYFRVPYAVQSEGLGLERLDGRLGVLRPLTPMSGDGQRLVWWRGGPNQTAATRAGRFQLAGFTIAAHLRGGGPDGPPHTLGPR